MNYAGVDWAADKHDVRVCDETGEELLATTFAHDERGLQALRVSLERLVVSVPTAEADLDEVRSMLSGEGYIPG